MNDSFKPFIKLLTLIVALLILATFLVGIVGVVIYVSSTGSLKISSPQEVLSSAPLSPELEKSKALADPLAMWQAPAWSEVEKETNAEEISYGKELVANTAEYLGPNGKVMKISNGMNCQNCHLNAGTMPLGNNFGGVASIYPKVRNRSGQSEGIPKRINDCFQRSLNGEGLPEDSKEMKAMVAYIKWVGKDVPKGEKPIGAGLYAVPLLDRPADPLKGKSIYERQCASCHMEDGQGMPKSDGSGYIYPPLWGPNSYNSGAGLFRLSRFAGYVKANMPLGSTYENPILSDEESWDLAAYVNSLERPQKDLSGDWPDISKKPMDHPFGPYSDSFSETQHKYGPFQEIIAAKEEVK